MYSFKRSNVVNTLAFICVFVIVTVYSNEDNSKDSKPDELQNGTTETILEDIIDAIKNDEEKESVQDENESEKVEPPTESGLLDVKEKIVLVKEVKETEKGVEESVKVVLKENVEEEDSEASSEAPKEPVSEGSIEIPTSDLSLHEKVFSAVQFEEAPEDTYAVWNSKGKICLLARFNATFSIVYPSKGGEQKAQVSKENGKAKGRCASNSGTPLLEISWHKYVLTMMFNKSDEENWVVTNMEFTYDTTDPIFDRATNAGKMTARSKSLNIFESPLGKAYYCPAQEVVLLYTANKQVVTARLKDMLLQPYAIEDGKFSPFHRCNKVVIDGPDETPFVQDETVPLAVGCTLALITLCILIGFSVHRAYNAAKVDYNNME